MALGMLDRLRHDRRVVLALMVPNLLGIGYGYYYYWQVGQFDPGSSEFRSYWLWPLIPDSPNAVVLMSAALVASAFWGRRWKWLDALAFTQMLYVGAWTTTLFLVYPERMGTFDWASWPQNANPLLFVSHMGMPLEALLLVPALRRDAWTWRAAAGLTAFSASFVWIDYWGPHIHPAPFLHAAEGDGALHAVSPWLMVASLLAWAWAAGLLTGRARAGTPPPASPGHG